MSHRAGWLLFPPEPTDPTYRSSPGDPERRTTTM